MPDYKIIEISDQNISSLETLNQEAFLNGENMIERTLEEWRTGKNTFSKPGEKLWGIFVQDECIAIGGLNIDPFLENNDGTVGRVRHIYVAQKYRRQGLSKILMNLIIEKARQHFKILRLSTRNPIAASLYLSFGFRKVTEDTGDRETYILDL